MDTTVRTWFTRACVAGIVLAVASVAAAGCSSGGGGTSDGGADGTTSCGSGTLCNGTCVNTQSDNANCGTCGTACATGEVCSQGKCATSCGGGTKLCGSICADTKNDPQNCGGCGTKCGAGEVCNAGSCGTTCASGQTVCGADAGTPYCASTKTDNANCGGCGVTCGSGQVCQNGACANACAASDGGVETLCTPDGGTPYCAKTDSDNTNCGGCGVACNSSEVCIGGQCKASVGCPVKDGVKTQAGPHVEYGFCWYLTADGETCDNACSAVGGANLATTAETAWADACQGATSADVSTWFFNNGNPGGWSNSTGGTSYHTLGYGYRNNQYYGKCSSGTATTNGAYPGDTNGSATRSVLCACFKL
jgi:hypothetical protein